VLDDHRRRCDDREGVTIISSKPNLAWINLVKQRREPVAVHILTPLIKAMSALEPVTTVGEPIDVAKYAWYERTCPCGLPAGGCTEHPRARESQMPRAGRWMGGF
jgi:hypothetical protein